MATTKSTVMDTATESPAEDPAATDVATQEKKAVESAPDAYAEMVNVPQTFEDAMATMEVFYGAKPATFNPYPLLDDKSKLLGIEFLVERFDFIMKKDKAGNITDEVSYVNVKGITKQGSKRFAFNDGSTGVCASLIKFAAKTGRNGGIHCPLGLRVSRYVGPTGEDSETFYLN